MSNIIRTIIICFILMISFNYKEIYANPNIDYKDIETRIEKIEENLESMNVNDVITSYNNLNKQMLDNADKILNRIMIIVGVAGGTLTVLGGFGIYKNAQDEKRFKELKQSIEHNEKNLKKNIKNDKEKIRKSISNNEKELNEKIQSIRKEYEKKFEEYKRKIDEEVQKQIQESINNNKISVYRNEIEQLIKDKNYNIAFEKYKQIEALDNDKVYVYNIKGWFYLQAYQDNKLGSYLWESIDAYQKVIYLYKKNKVQDNRYYEQLAIYHNNLGNTYYYGHIYDKAIDEYKNAIKISEENNITHSNSSYYINLANAYYANGNKMDNKIEYTNAINLYLKSININEKNELYYENANCYNLLGNAYHANGNYKEAVEAYNKAIEINNKYGQALNIKVVYQNLGNTYYANGEYENAIDAYKNLITVDKEELIVNKIYLGNSYSNNENYDELIELYEDILIKYPNRLHYKEKSYIYSELGEAYRKLKKFEKSILSGEEAVKIEKQGMYFLRLANTYREYDSIDKAKENYKIVIEKQREQIKMKEGPIPFLIPDSENTYSYAAEACMYLGEYLGNKKLNNNEAQKYLIEALEYNTKAINLKEPYINIKNNHQKIKELLSR